MGVQLYRIRKYRYVNLLICIQFPQKIMWRKKFDMTIVKLLTHLYNANKYGLIVQFKVIYNVDMNDWNWH